MAHDVAVLLMEARRYLHVSQGKLGELLGSSERTGQRWERGGYRPSDGQLHRLAGLIHPMAPELAQRIANAGATSLEQLGIVRPAAAPAPWAPDPEHLVDTVVCAAADAMGLTPEAVRPALRAAFRRARLVGLSAETVDQALHAADAAKTSSTVAKKKTS